MNVASEYAQLRARRLQRSKDVQEAREQADAATRHDFKKAHRSNRDQQTWQQRAVVAEGECARLRGELDKLRELDTNWEASNVAELQEALEEERQASETIAEALSKAQQQNKETCKELESTKHELEAAKRTISQLDDGVAEAQQALEQNQNAGRTKLEAFSARFCPPRRLCNASAKGLLSKQCVVP